MNTLKPKIIDTHTHLYDPVFRNDRTNLLVEARKRGIFAIISVSENLNDAKTNLKLAKVHAEIKPAIGLYPGIVDLDQAAKVEKFIVQNARKLVAIGEVGLDHWLIKDEAEREIQKSIFERFIELSLELKLPINVHSRSAGRHVIDLLLQKDASGVQLHAFDGKASSAMPAVEAGFFFSIPPAIIHSSQKQKLVKKLPLSALLLETDSPVLGPDPKVRNVPSNICIAAEAIADIKSIPLQEVYEVTLKNTLQLYGQTEPFLKMKKEEEDFTHTTSI